MALLTKIGYGQVEFNKVTSQGTKDIISQMPVANSITNVQMGSFLVPDYTKGVMKRPAAQGDAAYIVNNEIKNYKEGTSRKDFRLEYTNGTAHYTAQQIYPRCYKMSVGDVIHTNLIDGFSNASNAGDTFVIDTAGYLVADKNSTNIAAAKMVFEVAKVSSMPDGQTAAKLVCVKANY